MKEATSKASKTMLATPINIWLPAHVKELEVNDIAKKNGYDKKVFNVFFKIAPEAEKIVFKKVLFEDGKRVETDEQINGKYLAGRVVKSKGLFFTFEPKEEDSWMNMNYAGFFGELGVQFEEDGDDLLIGEVEEKDVLGKGCMIKIEEEPYKKDGVPKTALKVVTVMSTDKLKDLKPGDMIDDDLPF
ncbi:hypothetical protein ACFL4H_00275 [Candidatus Neomarinimicrobiota bacterium]